MIVEADKYNSETIADMIAELSGDNQLMSYLQSTDSRGEISIRDYLEIIATHLVMTDTDYNFGDRK